MGLSRVQIQILPDRQFPENTNLILSKSLAQKLGVKNRTIRTAFGSAIHTGRVALSKKPSQLIRVSSSLALQLRMCNLASINAYFDPYTLHLRLGPLFGILMNTAIEANLEQPFGAMSRFLEECAITGKSHGVLVFVFPPEQLKIEHKLIQGWVREQERWVQTTLPFPDAVYNRIMSRKIEQQESVQKKLDQLRHSYKVPIFNEKFLDKLQVFQILLPNPTMRGMTPETYRFEIPRLKEMLNKYPTLYIKPNNGSLGQGIIRIIQEPEHYICQISTQNGILSRQFTTPAELARALIQRIGKQSYLIQQGIHLVEYEGRKLDFRALAQKNSEGIWQITSIVARISNDNNIVSNASQGGTVRRASEILDELAHLPGKPDINQLRTIALDITHAFEALAQGHFAELGIDLALDKNGKVWLIEINSKPSKTDETMTNPTGIVRPSVTRLIQYVFFLSRFENEKKYQLPSSNKSLK